MDTAIPRHLRSEGFMRKLMRFEMNVENFKRRRALAPRLDAESRLFFERIMSVKKMQELVFITKTHKSR